MKIVAVCGCGMGSSVVLKMNAKKALDSLNYKADLEVADLMTAKAAIATADLVLIGKELAKTVKDVQAPVIVLNSFVNKNEVREKLEKYLREAGEI